MDYVVGEVERDGIEREIGVFDVFAEDGVAVSVTAGESGCVVGMDSQCPNLEFFGSDFFVIGPNESNLVEEPVGSAVFSDVLCSVGVESHSIDGMSIPLFGSRELARSTASSVFLSCVSDCMFNSFLCALLHKAEGAGHSQGRSAAEFTWP
jgi:hypothetical protein